MVQIAVTLGSYGANQLGRQRAERNGDVALAGGCGHNPHVLVVQIDPKTRFEVARQHVRRLSLQDSAPGQPAGEDSDCSLGVYPVRPQEDEGFGDQFDGARDDELVGRLDRLA